MYIIISVEILAEGNVHAFYLIRATHAVAVSCRRMPNVNEFNETS